MSRTKSIPRTILGVALPLGITILSTIARADEIPLWMLITEPNASISVGSLRFSNFGFFGFFPGSPLEDFRPEKAEEIRYYCENVPDPFCQQTIAPFARNSDNGLGVHGEYVSTSFALLTFDVTSSFGLRGMTIAFDFEPVPKPGDPGDTFATATLFPSFNNGFSAYVERVRVNRNALAVTGSSVGLASSPTIRKPDAWNLLTFPKRMSKWKYSSAIFRTEASPHQRSPIGTSHSRRSLNPAAEYCSHVQPVWRCF
jgi:hypothetical protein